MTLHPHAGERMARDHFELKVCSDCPMRAGPCLAGYAFMSQLGASCQIAGRITGTAPEIAGKVTLETCPARANCDVSFAVNAGALELSRHGHVLLRGRIAPVVMQ
jgi:hypothetical protein